VTEPPYQIPPDRARRRTSRRRAAHTRHFLLLVVAAAVIGGGIGWLVNRESGQPAQTTSAQRTVPARQHHLVLTLPSRKRGIGHLGFVQSGAAASFSALETQLPGAAGLAVAQLGTGQLYIFGRARVARAWSTSKVPVVVALLRDYEHDGGHLDAQERVDATRALEESDNAAIDALFARLEQIHGGLEGASLALQDVLREAGDRETVINTAPNDRGFTTEGQTQWSTRGEVLFYRALDRGCLLSRRDTAYVVGLMQRVVPYERWGAGSAGYPSGQRLAFKGGWGPDAAGRYQVRQTAIVSSGSRGYVVSILALPSNGSFAEGTAMVTAIARWARQHLDLHATQSSSHGCG
jgi:Beta-lactamase enzyme family